MFKQGLRLSDEEKGFDVVIPISFTTYADTINEAISFMLPTLLNQHMISEVRLIFDVKTPVKPCIKVFPGGDCVVYDFGAGEQVFLDAKIVRLWQ
jgi:hypothetical protein